MDLKKLAEEWLIGVGVTKDLGALAPSLVALLEQVWDEKNRLDTEYWHGVTKRAHDQRNAEVKRVIEEMEAVGMMPHGQLFKRRLGMDR